MNATIMLRGRPLSFNVFRSGRNARSGPGVAIPITDAFAMFFSFSLNRTFSFEMYVLIAWDAMMAIIRIGRIFKKFIVVR